MHLREIDGGQKQSQSLLHYIYKYATTNVKPSYNKINSVLHKANTSVFQVVNAKPYGDGIVIKKKECIGYVQKRVGCRCVRLSSSL